MDESGGAAAAWDRKYAAPGRVRLDGPHEVVASLVELTPAGRALDLGCGEGRHARWLAAAGWDVLASDVSKVGIAAGREAGLPVRWDVRDLETDDRPWGETFDLVLVAYLQLPEMGPVLGRAAAAVAEGGRLVLVGHHATHRAHGPADPARLLRAAVVVPALAGLSIDRCTTLQRGEAVDLLVLAHR